MKKIIAFALLICVVASVCCFPALADEPTEDDFSGIGVARASYYLVYGYNGEYRVPFGTVVGIGYTTSGTYVKAVQDHGNFMNEQLVMAVDGQFGTETYTYVFRWQQTHSECGTPDGIVGPKTWQSFSSGTI